MNMTAFTGWAAKYAEAVAISTICGAITLLAMAISYQHEVTLARNNGQVTWVADTLPFAVDGMLMISSIALYWAARHGIRRPVQPLFVGGVGIAATISANFFSDWRLWWLGPAVSGSAGVAVVLIGWVAWWMLGTQRQLADGTLPQRDVNCSCPPPATSLAEALPLAKKALQDAGLPHGQEALAAQFGVSVHRVRQVLAPPVEKALMNGAGKVPHGEA